jgi:Protein of unknown function (DUF4236)
MPLRFYRRFRAGPFRMNLSKGGVSWSVGGKGESARKYASHARQRAAASGRMKLLLLGRLRGMARQWLAAITTNMSNALHENNEDRSWKPR